MWKHFVWLVVDSFISAANVVNCVIPEVVDRQISGMCGARVIGILCTSMKTLCKCLVEVILS